LLLGALYFTPDHLERLVRAFFLTFISRTRKHIDDPGEKTAYLQGRVRSLMGRKMRLIAAFVFAISGNT